MDFYAVIVVGEKKLILNFYRNFFNESYAGIKYKPPEFGCGAFSCEVNVSNIKRPFPSIMGQLFGLSSNSLFRLSKITKNPMLINTPLNHRAHHFTNLHDWWSMLQNKAEGLNIGIPLLLLVRLVVTSVAKTGMVMSNTTQIFRLGENIPICRALENRFDKVWSSFWWFDI